MSVINEIKTSNKILIQTRWVILELEYVSLAETYEYNLSYRAYRFVDVMQRTHNEEEDGACVREILPPHSFC